MLDRAALHALWPDEGYRSKWRFNWFCRVGHTRPMREARRPHRPETGPRGLVERIVLDLRRVVTRSTVSGEIDVRDRPYDSDSTPQVAQIVPDGPEGHQFLFAVRRSDAEVAELANTCESVDDARQRLGPRLRCECGRGFPDRMRFDEHLADPRRDQRNQLNSQR